MNFRKQAEKIIADDLDDHLPGGIKNMLRDMVEAALIKAQIQALRDAAIIAQYLETGVDAAFRIRQKVLRIKEPRRGK